MLLGMATSLACSLRGRLKQRYTEERTFEPLLSGKEEETIQSSL